MLPVGHFKFLQKGLFFHGPSFVHVHAKSQITIKYTLLKKKKRPSSQIQEKSNSRDLTVLFAEWRIQPLIIYTQWKWTLLWSEITLTWSDSQRIWWIP